MQAAALTGQLELHPQQPNRNAALTLYGTYTSLISPHHAAATAAVDHLQTLQPGYSCRV
jgi:hypothetical protein